VPSLGPQCCAQPRASFTPNRHAEFGTSRRRPSPPSAALNHGPTSHPIGTGSVTPHDAIPRPEAPRSTTGQLHGQSTRAVRSLTAPPLGPKCRAHPRASFMPNGHGDFEASRHHPSVPSAALNHGPAPHPVGTETLKPHCAIPRTQAQRSTMGQLRTQWARGN